MDDFLANHWERKELVVSRDVADYYAGLPGMDDIDELITATAPSASRSVQDGALVRTSPAGETTDRMIQLNGHGIPDIQAVYRAYRAGYSVVLNSIQHRSTAVAMLCRAVEAELHHRVNANLYLTPRGSQGFQWHADDHDVLIVQLHGTKRWHLGGVGSEPFRPEVTPDAERQVDLFPGDALYVPRGLRHKAVTATTSSLHLTIGIHVHTWADLISEMLAVFVQMHPETLRAALPPGHALSPTGRATFDTALRQVEDALRDESLLDQAMQSLRARLLNTGNAAAPGQFRAIDAVHSLSESTMLRHAPGVHGWIHIEGDEARLQFTSNYVAGPADAVGRALRFIAEHARFAVAEVPGLSSSDRLGLIDRLVSEGMLSIATEGDGQ